MIEEIDINDPRADDVMDPEQKEQLMEEIELLDGASAEFSQEEVSKGQLTPVFFGSALTNFWCGNISGAFPEDDHFSASENCRLRTGRSYE